MKPPRTAPALRICPLKTPLKTTAPPSAATRDERGQGLDRLPDIGVLAALVIYVVLLLSTGR